MPKYLADRISIDGSEYRVIADTQDERTEVWGKDLAWEFRNRAAAYSYLAEAYKTAQDFRNIAPGQEIQLTMADGTVKTVNVISNDAMQVAFTDAGGKQYTFPHMQPGVQPRIMPKKNPNTPSQSGDEGGPEQGDNSFMAPGTGTTTAHRTSSGVPSDLVKKWPKHEIVKDKETGKKHYDAQQYPEAPAKGQNLDIKAYYENHPCNECGEKRCESCGVCHNCQDKKALSKRQAESFPHRHPQNCKHDGAYLQRKDPSDPEKACPQCGMVYEAAVDEREVVNSDPMFKRLTPQWVCPRCPRNNPMSWATCPCGAKRPSSKLSKKQAGTFSPFDEAPKFPKGGPKYEHRPYRCMNCGHEKTIGTNHEGRVIDYCEGCSWKPSFGKAEYAVPFNGRTYRPFEYAGPTERTVLQSRTAGCDSDFFVEGDHCECPAHKGKKALSKKAFHFTVGDTVRFKHPTLGETAGKIVRDDGNQYVIRQGEEMLAVPAQYVLGPVYNANRRIAQPMTAPPSGPPGQNVPPSSPPMSTQQTGPQQAPAGDQAQPVDQPGQNRALSRHEIITEAEILIRNALHKGIRIGTWDLVEYMQQNYSNPPEELYEGATKAWEKVQWEEQEAFESSKGPGPSQQKHPGDEAQEAPTSVEDVANQPRTGPTQVKV